MHNSLVPWWAFWAVREKLWERGTTVSGGASNRQVWCNLYEDGKWNKWQGKSKKFWDMSLVQQMTHFCYLEILFWLEMFLFKIVLVYSNTTKYCTLNIHFCIEKFYFRTITVFYVLEEGFTTVTWLTHFFIYRCKVILLFD